MSVTRETVQEVLKTINDPISGSDIMAAGLVRALMVEGDTVRFVLEVDPKRAEEFEPVRAEAEAKGRHSPRRPFASPLSVSPRSPKENKRKC